MKTSHQFLTAFIVLIIMFVFGLFQSKKDANIGLDDVVTVAKSSQLKAVQDKISEMKKSIVVDNLEPLNEITLPLTINGKAVGGWYSGGNFDILILDESGHQLATSTATAESEWLTTDFVNFKAVIEFVPHDPTLSTVDNKTPMIIVFKGANQESIEIPLFLISK